MLRVPQGPDGGHNADVSMSDSDSSSNSNNSDSFKK